MRLYLIFLKILILYAFINEETGVTAVSTLRQFRLSSVDTTWNFAALFCRQQSTRLCTKSELFPDESGVSIYGILQGNHLAPIGDKTNAWVYIGEENTGNTLGDTLNLTSWINSCPYGTVSFKDGSPAVTAPYCPWKGNVFCCDQLIQIEPLLPIVEATTTKILVTATKSTRPCEVLVCHVLFKTSLRCCLDTVITTRLDYKAEIFKSGNSKKAHILIQENKISTTCVASKERLNWNIQLKNSSQVLLTGEKQIYSINADFSDCSNVLQEKFGIKKTPFSFVAQEIDNLNNLLMSSDDMGMEADEFLLMTSRLLKDVEEMVVDATNNPDNDTENMKLHYNNSRINMSVNNAQSRKMKPNMSPLLKMGQTKLYNIERLPGDHNENLSIVTTAMTLASHVQQGAIKNATSFENILVSDFPLPDVPVVAVSAFDIVTKNRIQVALTYSVKVENDSSIADYIIPKLKASGFEKKVVRKVNYVCKYYDANTMSYSAKGCILFEKGSREVKCNCNHTTIFAVLLSVESYNVPNGVKIISYVTESLSVLCLLLVLVVLVKVRKKIRIDRTLNQINLSLALLFLHFFNLLHDVALRNNRMCELTAILIHFFLLATASWMFVEGFSLFFKTSDQALSFNNKNPKIVGRIKLLIGWGVPGLIVLIATITGFATGMYMENVEMYGYKRCWLNSKNGMLLGSVIIPVALICVLNLGIIIKVLYFVYKMSIASDRLKPTNRARRKLKSQLSHVRVAVKGVMLLFPVLGIPWIITFLSGLESYEAAVVFMYLNAILNGLQGLFLFFVYCVCGTEVRKIWTRQISQSFSSFTSFDRMRAHKSHTVSNVEMTGTIRNLI